MVEQNEGIGPEELGRAIDQIQGHFDAILVEKDRALQMASDEREKAASALRGEQQRALDQAGRERDKAAETLSKNLAQSIKEGDERLREHISNQIMQINAALASADKLEVSRIGNLESQLHALEKLLRETGASQHIAQGKFEESVRHNFSQVNEFRAALDDLGKLMATRREIESLTASTIERYEDNRRQIDQLRSRLDTGPEALRSLQSGADRMSGRQDGSASMRVAIFGSIAAGVAILSAVIVLANVFTRSSSNPAPTVVCTTAYHPAPCP